MKQKQGLRAIQAQRYLRYSIRKFTVGVASVAIATGLMMFGVNVQAAEEGTSATVQQTNPTTAKPGKNVNKEGKVEKTNTEKKDTVLVKNYVISEEGSMIDVEVEYKNNIAQKMTQLFVNKPISELTQNEKFKFDDVIESMQSTEAKEKIIEESKGLKLIAKEENNNLTIKAILDLNEISESDAKNALGNFDGSLDDARKIDNFEKILAKLGVIEKK